MIFILLRNMKYTNVNYLHHQTIAQTIVVISPCKVNAEDDTSIKDSASMAEHVGRLQMLVSDAVLTSGYFPTSNYSQVTNHS